MKKRIILILIAVMTVVLAACSAATESTSETAAPADGDMQLLEPGKLIVATEASFPPYVMVAEDGEGVAGTGLEGIDIELAAAIADKLGLELVVQNVEFDYALYSPQNGKADLVIGGLTASSERKQFMLFSECYFDAFQVVIVPEDSEIDTPADLLDRKIAVVRNTTAWIYCLNNYGEKKVSVFDSCADLVDALLEGRVEAIVLDEAPAEAIVQETEGLVILKKEFTDDEFAIGMAKDNVGLQNAVDEALAELKSDGTLQKIIEGHIPSNPI